MPIQARPVEYDVIQFGGGLDLTTPTISLRPGMARDGLNFEWPTTGGLRRIEGYERYDGQTSPSTAVYQLITVSTVAGFSVGNTITGVTSGATAVIASIGATQLAVTKKVGSFAATETLNVGGSPIATVTSVDGLSSDPLQSAVYYADAADIYRADITAPTGSGPARGVVYYNGTLYVFRNNAGGTAVDLWKSTTAGWVQVPFYKTVSFTAGGTATPVEGATLTQGGVTATVKRIVKRTGAWGGTAAGTLVITTPSGGNFAAGAATIGTTTLTLSGAQTAITLAPGGHFEFAISNFGGSAGTERVFGVDGVNKAFEFDGDILAPISTGMTVDTPKHIAAHKNYLFLTFGASVQFSGVGDPYGWEPILGAGEFTADEVVTNLTVLPGSQAGAALLIHTRNSTKILYGSDTTDFNLVSYNTGVGAFHYTTANLGGTYSFDDRGVMELQASLNYGNFNAASLTANILPFVIENKQFTSCATVNREKNQYRVFFTNGKGLYLTMINGQFLGAMPVNFSDPVYCIWSGEDSTGAEITFFGGNSGMVYQLDKGSSFDGENIHAYVTFSYNHEGGPRVRKRYRKASVEVFGGSYTEIDISTTLGYGNQYYAPQTTKTYINALESYYWDSGLYYDYGISWDGRSPTPVEVELNGIGENIAVAFNINNNYSEQFTLNSIIIHYSNGRGIR